MDTEYLVLTAVGSDRVGIASDVSEEITSRGLNIEESRMAVLGGEFAIIMLVSGPSAAAVKALDELPGAGERLRLRVELRRTSVGKPLEAGRPYVLSTVSLDTPGIVRSVTAVLKKYGVNVESLETETSAAPWSGAPLFRMRAEVIVPPAVSAARLREEFGRLQLSQDLDIDFRPRSTAS